jgi:hypothetical protein
VCGDRRKVHEACTLSMVIQALEFEPVGPQNQWVDAMFLTVLPVLLIVMCFSVHSTLLGLCI